MASRFVTKGRNAGVAAKDTGSSRFTAKDTHATMPP
jgi:hypothetical protein